MLTGKAVISYRRWIFVLSWCKSKFFSVCILICSLLGIFSWGFTRAEAAESQKLTYFHTESFKQDGRQWQRIELGLSGQAVEYNTRVSEILFPKQLHVILQGVAKDNVRTEAKVDKKVLERLNVRDDGRGNLDVVLNCQLPVNDQFYKLYTAEADKKAKKPFRLIIEVAENKLPSEYEGYVAIDDKVENVKGHTIVLDPGHGGSDSGARGPHGVMEKTCTLGISLKLRDILTANGAKVIMTRDTDVDVYGPNASDRQELQARVDVAAAHPRAEIFVSVHCDAFSTAQPHGTSTFYYESSTKSQQLAESVLKNVLKQTGLTSRGAKTARFYVLRNTDIPATLVETAFITNPAEEAMLADEEFQYTMALAIARGMGEYFGNK